MAKKSSNTANVIITMEGKQAVDYMKKLKQRADDVRNALKKMEAAGKTDTTGYKKASENLKAMERAIRENKNAYIDLNSVVKNLNSTTLRQLQRSLKECKRQMQNLTANDPKMKTLMAQYRAIDNQIGKITGQWKRQDGAIMSVIKRLTAYVSVYGAFNFAVSKLKDVFRKNLEFSDQLADIRKTTKLSTDTVNELSAAINKIDSRRGVTELHNLAFEAGRLGIGGGGAEAVLGFVRAADKLGVALKEHLGDDAIVTLTKMADVMGLTKKMGVEKSLLSIGSAINELAQNSTATGQFLTDYAQRLSGIATQAHLTTAELLGLAAASDSTGQEVEVSATAMNKFLVQLQTHYKTVAAAAQVDENVLHEMLETGRTADAVVMVLEALSKRGGLSNVAPLMKDLGSDGARLTASLSTLASNVDLVKQQLNLARQAFDENISVTNEYNIKNDTAAAIMERMRNSWDKLFQNAENAEAVKNFAQELYDVSMVLEKNQSALTILKVTLFALKELFLEFIRIIPYLGALFSTKYIMIFVSTLTGSFQNAILGTIGWFRALGSSADAATGSITRTAAATRVLGRTLKSNAFLFAASIILELVLRVGSLRKELSLAKQATEDFNAGLAKFKDNTAAADVEVNQLFSRLKNATNGSKERTNLITQINKQYGKYLPNLLSEKSSLEDIAKAQEIVNKKLRQSLALKAKNSAMDDVSQKFMPKMAEATNSMKEVYAKHNLSGVGEDDIRFMVEQTQKLYDAGENYNSIKDKVWKSMYYTSPDGPKASGRSAALIAGNGRLAPDWKTLQNAVDKYVTNFWNMNAMAKKASDTYDPLIGDYTEDEGTPHYDINQQVKQSEVNKAERERLKVARDEHKAVMAALEVYYQQQEQVINDWYLQRKITEEQREQELEDIENRHLRSRIAARAALHNDDGALKEWKTEIARMYDENLAETQNSFNALNNIMGKDLKRIGDDLRRFGEAEDDGIWKKLEEDKKKMQENEIDLRKQIETILRQNDFTGIVTDKYIAAMQRLGVFFPALKDKMGRQIKDIKKSAEEGMASLYVLYPKLFSLDINTAEGLAEFRKMLQEAESLGEEMMTLSEENMRILYYQVLEYGDAMAEAEKKARDRSVKIGEARYKQTPTYKGNESSVSSKKETVEVYKSAKNIGLATDTMVADAEVQLYEARLKAAQDYYNYLKSEGRDTKEAEIQIQQAVAELASSLAEKTAKQLETLKSYCDNLEEFGTNFGESVFGSLDDRQDALKSFVQAVGKTTQQLINNWLKQKIEHALLKKAMAKTEKDTAESMTQTTQEGQQDVAQAVQRGATDTTKKMAKAAQKRLRTTENLQQQEVDLTQATQDTVQTIEVGGQQAVADATAAIGETSVAIQASQAATSVSTTAAETEANVGMGIASGAAKTIGQLGWWGIPLVAVLTALLSALLGAAMSKVTSLFGGSNSSTSTTTKLSTGMLTYDSGNVQSVMADTGTSYSAQVTGISGSGVVTRPTLTNVGGVPALVGEEGPEIVIGRRTTRALRQDNSGLLQGLIAFDKMHSGRGFRTYDSGNVSDYAGGASAGDASGNGDDANAALEAIQPVLAQLAEALQDATATNQRLRDRLDKPIAAQMNVHGENGALTVLSKEMDKARRFGRNQYINRLFGS